MVDVRIATKEEVLENRDRTRFMAGGWINDSEPDVIYLYWNRSQEHFTTFSLLRILEHEILHSVLAMMLDLETSAKLDSIHHTTPVWLENGELIFVSRFKVKQKEPLKSHYIEQRNNLQKAEV